MSVSFVACWYLSDWYRYRLKYRCHISNENIVSGQAKAMSFCILHCADNLFSTKSNHHFSVRHSSWRRWSAAWRPASPGVKGHLRSCVQLSAVGALWSHPDTRWRWAFFSRCVSLIGGDKAWNVSFPATVALTHHCVLTGCAALVKVPSVGVAPVKETQPVTPVSITAQVGSSNSFHLTCDRQWHFSGSFILKWWVWPHRLMARSSWRTGYWGRLSTETAHWRRCVWSMPAGTCAKLKTKFTYRDTFLVK